MIVGSRGTTGAAGTLKGARVVGIIMTPAPGGASIGGTAVSALRSNAAITLGSPTCPLSAAFITSGSGTKLVFCECPSLVATCFNAASPKLCTSSSPS